MVEFQKTGNGTYESKKRHPLFQNAAKYIVAEGGLLYLGGTLQSMEEGDFGSLEGAMRAADTIERGGNPFYDPDRPETWEYTPWWKPVTFDYSRTLR
jgi:hypothetical protein